MKCSYNKIKKIVYLYMILPLFCFIAFYLHSIFGGIFLGILYILSIIRVRISWKQRRIYIKKEKVEYDDVNQAYSEMRIEKKYLFLFMLVAIIWSFLGGQGNLYYQSHDWGCRNAIYRDIIYRDWPVIYIDYNKALVYYIGYWLPPAAIIKIIGFFIPQIYLSDQAFFVGNILLWMWTSVGIFLTEILLFTYAKPKRRYRALLVPVILIFFSGMDIIGVLRNIIVEGRGMPDLHLEWWNPILQFSSLTTCLFWVFNQTIIPWLAILCVLQEKNVCNYVFIGICVFAAGPIPMVGIAVYMLLLGIYNGIISIVTKRIKRYLIEVFSPVNCLAIFLLPIFILYYKSNQAIINSSTGETAMVFSVFKMETITSDFIKQVFVFLMLEVGIYIILLYKNFKRDIFYYIVIVTAIMAPFFKIGGKFEFVMRFSIPTIMVLAAMCLKYLVNYTAGNAINDLICGLLCLCLAIGAVTPMTEMFRGYNTILQTGKIVNVCDDIVTYNQDIPDNNFTSHDYKNSLFFKYFYSEE